MDMIAEVKNDSQMLYTKQDVIMLLEDHYEQMRSRISDMAESLESADLYCVGVKEAMIDKVAEILGRKLPDSSYVNYYDECRETVIPMRKKNFIDEVVEELKA